MAEKQLSNNSNEKNEVQSGILKAGQIIEVEPSDNAKSEEHALEDELAKQAAALAEFSMLSVLMEDMTPETSRSNITDDIAEKSETLGLFTENAQTPTTSESNLFTEGLSKLLDMNGIPDDHSANAMLALMSNEVLCPILKTVTDIVQYNSYPAWLAKNKHKMSQSLYATYFHQYELMHEACTELESERDDDPASIKEQRSEKILDLVHQILDCCQPPQELTEHIGSLCQDVPTVVELCLIM